MNRTLIALFGVLLMATPVLVGCDKGSSSETTTVKHPDGSTTTDQKSSTVHADGSTSSSHTSNTTP